VSKLRVVDIETGEDLTAEHKIINRKQVEAYKRKLRNEEARLKGREIDFTFSVMDALHEVTSVLTNAQCGYMLVLQGYMNYDGVLVNPNNTLMKTSDMMDVLNLREKTSTFYDFLNKATANRIILRNDDGSYSINQRYHFRGPIKGRQTVKSFTRSVRKAFAENKPEDLGLIYRMLPFVNMRTNTLCHNPYETIPERVRPLKAKELAEVIGVTPATLSRRVSEWTFNGEYVLAKVKVGKRTQYMFNPWIIYRGSIVPDDTARAIFAIKPTSKN
jgi:hypothetical protein